MMMRILAACRRDRMAAAEPQPAAAAAAVAAPAGLQGLQGLALPGDDFIPEAQDFGFLPGSSDLQPWLDSLLLEQHTLAAAGAAAQPRPGGGAPGGAALPPDLLRQLLAEVASAPLPVPQMGRAFTLDSEYAAPPRQQQQSGGSRGQGQPQEAAQAPPPAQQQQQPQQPVLWSVLAVWASAFWAVAGAGGAGPARSAAPAGAANPRFCRGHRGGGGARQWTGRPAPWPGPRLPGDHGRRGRAGGALCAHAGA